MNDPIDFSSPMNQSPVAIILLIWKYFVNIIRQFWPAIIAVFIGQRSGNMSNLIIFSIIAVAASALIFAIAYYLRFSFYVKDDELHIHKGVLKKTNLNIPFERIQTLNFEESIIHQIFSVVKIEVDTAGSSKNEFTFNAIQRPIAEALRNQILSRKSEISEVSERSETEVVENTQSITSPKSVKIFGLDFKDLFIIGLTQNHLRTVVLIFFFLLWGIGELEDSGLNIDFNLLENAEAIVQSGIIFLIGLSVVSLIIIIIGTSIRTIVKYFDFAMYRSNDGFKIQSGLFNRKEYAALDHKIQQIKWINNPLKRIFKIHQLQLKQASSIEVSSRKSIKVPGIQIEKIRDIIDYSLKSEIDLERLELQGIERQYLIRNILYFSIFPWLALSFGLHYWLENKLFFLILLIIPYLVITYYVAFRKWKFAYDANILYTHHGVFENKNNIIEIHKIQNVQITQSPYQWRRDLANLQIYTAAGQLKIPYIKREKALVIKDFLLYKVETSKEKWY